MGRRLPDYNRKVDGPYESSKRRVQIFKRIYQNMEHWRAQQEDYGLSDVITTIDGEDVYYGDLMVGEDTLPLRQKQAFRLICLQGYTEKAATDILLPNSKWTTPVQQYSDDALKKMIAAYDEKQAGTWNPEAVKKKRRAPIRKKDAVTADTAPEVPESTVAPKSEPRRWDFTTWSEDHESLARYITDHGVDITPAQVKAVSFLRKQWYDSPAEIAERALRKALRRSERDKFANESPEQRKARHLAARKLRSAELTRQKLADQEAEIKRLREQAGLDPETGEPVGE